ncbi:hypothetical protein ACEPPN_006433 [Leptodophora sp. 'Broadleaf-Isolate-01']
MEHIARPGCSSPLPHIQVPYLCGQLPPCSGSEYYEWLAGTSAWFTSCRDDPLDDFAAKVQNHLYFGLLSAFLCTNVKHASFLLTNDDGRQYVDSVQIQNTLQKWEDDPMSWSSTTPTFQSRQTMQAFKEACENPDEAFLFAYTDARYSEVSPMLRQTWRVVSELLDYLLASKYDPKADLWSQPLYGVFFSVDVLLDQLYSSLFGPKPRARHPQRRSLVAHFPPLRNSIRKSGRCPSLPWRLNLSATDCYRLIFLSIHSPSQDHDSCTPQRCNIFASPKTEHRDNCRGCPSIKSDLKTVLRCISEDSIPLVRCEENEQGNVRIETVEGSLLSDYTAISHVWTGGLGNTTENSLPQCQLQYLLHAVTDLPPAPLLSILDPSNDLLQNIRGLKAWLLSRLPFQIDNALNRLSWKAPHRQALFWIDSLCIPNNIEHVSISDENREEIKSSKAKAINSMAQLYAGAEQVLVLDPEMRELSSEVLSYEKELLALYIRASPWMARSWPLQEGALAQNLYFRLKDRSLLLEESHYDLIGLQSLKMLQYYKEYKATSKSRAAGRRPASRFVSVWNSLVNRTTTQADDLPAIVAAMMDCSAGEVLKFTPEDRMRALLKKESSLPLVLFYQPTMTSLADGQWNPKIPGSDGRQTRIEPRYGSFKVTDRGLLLEDVYQTRGFVLDAVPDDDVFAFLVEKADGKCWRYVVSQEPGTVVRGRQSTARTFFLLSELCAADGSNYHGARFSVIREDSKELTIRHEAPVLFKYLDDTANPGGAERIYTNCKEEKRLGQQGFEVILDLGPDLKWKRNVALPLAQVVNDGYSRMQIAALLTIATPYMVFAFASVVKRDLQQWRAFWVWRVEEVLLMMVGCVRMVVAWVEIGIFSQRMTRAIQTVWAASFFDSASLPRKLLSFEGVAFPWAMPWAVYNVVLGCILLLGWTTLRFTPMLDWGMMLLIEPPVFLTWKMVLCHSSVFTQVNFALWLGSSASTLLIVRIAFTVALLVIPAVGTASWFYFDDGWMAIPFALPLVLYPILLYLDQSRGLSRWLVEKDKHNWLAFIGFLLIFYFAISTLVLFGVRYSAPHPLVAALLYSWVLFFGMGYWCASSNG